VTTPVHKNNGNADPSANSHNFLDKAVRRLDDLREAERQRVNEQIDAERRRVDEQLSIRSDFAQQLNLAEAKRIDAIRAVDVTAVATANEKATAQATVLANQVSQSAETLRSLVAATAATQAQQLTQLTNQLTDRLASLEKASYEGSGKNTVADPMMAALVLEIKSLRDANASSRGSRDGMQSLWGWIFGGLMFLVGLAGIIFAAFRK
jgi:hypothetical protein